MPGRAGQRTSITIRHRCSQSRRQNPSNMGKARGRDTPARPPLGFRVASVNVSCRPCLSKPYPYPCRQRRRCRSATISRRSWRAPSRGGAVAARMSPRWSLAGPGPRPPRGRRSRGPRPARRRTSRTPPGAPSCAAPSMPPPCLSSPPLSWCSAKPSRNGTPSVRGRIRFSEIP